MAVDEDGGRGGGAGVFGVDDGLAAGLQALGLQARRGELIAQPCGAVAAVAVVGGIGADAGEAQEPFPEGDAGRGVE